MKMDGSYVVYYGEEGKEIFPSGLEQYLSAASSAAYSPQLAHILTAFAYAAYDEENAKRSMESFGFENLYSDYGNVLIGYTLGKKSMPDGRTLVLAAIRGSAGVTEWLSNFNLLEITQMDGTSLHSGFWKAASTVYKGLSSCLNGNWENTVFVFTGHSRGAAAANLLEKYLASHIGVKQSCIYGYNIACPDVAAGSESDWNPEGEYDNIFNIANAKDIVSLIPGALGTAVFDKGQENWGKFGRSYWFTEKEGDIEINPATHELSVYLGYLRKEYPLSTYKSRTSLDRERADKVKDLTSHILIKNPGDAVITNKAGQKVLSFLNGRLKIDNSFFSGFGGGEE